MPYVTSIEQLGYDRGKVDGREEEARSLILLQLNQKFESVSEPLNNRISTLSPEQLKQLAIALLSFASIDDLTNWLDHQD